MKLFKIKKITFIILYFLFCSIHNYCQEILPFVENFTNSDYKGENQVWSIAKSNDNSFYFANNHFLLKYNGVKWENYSLPKKTIIRSVFVLKDKIFVGSYKEFGYWKKENNSIKYYSLSSGKNLFIGNSINGEIWKIFTFKNKMYFQTFNSLFIYDGRKIETINLPFQISYCYPQKNNLYIASINNGIYELDSKNKIIEVQKWNSLKNTIIYGIEEYQNKKFIFTKKSGIFVDVNNKLSEWDIPVLNSILKKELISCATFSKNKLIVGTVFNGVYIYDFDKNTYINICKKNSLKNNTVLSLFVDNENDIWLGLDNGISRIEINSPYTIFSDNSGVLGSIYSILPQNKNILLGSNHGVFNIENTSLQFIKGSEGQVWSITQVENKIIIGHNDGTFEYNNGNFIKLNEENGGFKLLKSNYSNRYFQANYSGLVIYNDATLNKYFKIEALKRPIKDIIEVSENELWATDKYKGFYKIGIENDKVKVENFIDLYDIKNDYDVKILQFKNENLFYANNKWYKLDKIKGAIAPYDVFNKLVKNLTNVVTLDNNRLLVLKNGLLYIIKVKNGEFIWQLIPKKYYYGKVLSGDISISKLDNKTLINLDDGFLVYDETKENIKKTEIKIEGVTSYKTIKYNQSLELYIVDKYYGFNKANLFYDLNNSGKKLAVTDGKITLNDLSSGKKTITIYNYDGFNFKKVKQQIFTVNRPWYFSNLLLGIYLLIMGLLIYAYHQKNKIKYQDKLKLKQSEFEQQNKILQIELEAEKKIKSEQYEKSIIENKFHKKESEVAGKSFSIAKQTEIIEKIKNILDTDENITTLKSKIYRLIKNNLTNKNEWKEFEINLSNSNEFFIKSLHQKFSNLTPKDIKLCIYLKMNLSTKEIAQLMNISQRGVEIHRYRIRKKLNLNKEDVLATFLTDFNPNV